MGQIRIPDVHSKRLAAAFVATALASSTLAGEGIAAPMFLECEVTHNTNILDGSRKGKTERIVLRPWRFKIDGTAKTVEVVAIHWANSGYADGEVTEVEFTPDMISFCLIEGGCPGHRADAPNDTSLHFAGKVRINRKSGGINQRRLYQIGPSGGPFSSTLEYTDEGTCEPYEETRNKF